MWVLRSRDETPRVLRITPGSTRTIGRGPQADFVIEGSLLSRLHCRLAATTNALTVEDLHSTNGTFVNDSRVQESPLHEGDQLRLGRLELTVTVE